MFSVVNHITLSTPLDDQIIQRMQDELMVQARDVEGFVAAYCTQPAMDEIVLVLLTRTAEAMKAMHESLDSPWISQHLAPYVASADRKPGPVIAHS